ncbi:hypothetical protein [Nitrosomonas sp. ANs5]|uniref:hypothetical protein n=1 Tax=Nitrosomonas sp. ANs5 TaxID=3423941 RepID=UPI003D348C57
MWTSDLKDTYIPGLEQAVADTRARRTLESSVTFYFQQLPNKNWVLKDPGQ